VNKLTEESFDEWYQSLPLLTYGEIDDNDVYDAFIQILTWKLDSVFISDVIPDGKYTVVEYWLYLGLLRECIDYGTSPRGAWVNDFGLQVLDYLKNMERINE